ncbi:MAG: hypothetical protein ACI9S8_000463 [Chlamydiales bacterium]
MTKPTKWRWNTQGISSRKVSTFLRSKPVQRALFTSLFLAVGVATYVLFRKNTLTEKERKSLKNLSISSMSSPLSQSQTRLTVESLEKHLKGHVPLGFSKLRKKDPFHQQIGLPCSLIVKADREGHIAKVYLSLNQTLQEGIDKRVQRLRDIQGIDHKVLLKAKRTLNLKGNKINNPHFESAKKNIVQELGIQKYLPSIGIASAPMEDLIRWKKEPSGPGQIGYIMVRCCMNRQHLPTNTIPISLILY